MTFVMLIATLPMIHADVTLWVRATDAPHIYVEGNGTESLSGYNVWPGKTLDTKLTVEDGSTWWKCVLEGVDNIPKLIINNGNAGGNNQTTDINDVTGTRYYHYNNYGFYLDLTSVRNATTYCFFQPMIKGSSDYDWTKDGAVFTYGDTELTKCGGYNTPYNEATDVYVYVGNATINDGARFTFSRKQTAKSKPWNRILVQYHKGGYYQNTGWGDTNTTPSSANPSWANADAYTNATWYGAEECTTEFHDILWPIEVSPRPVKVLTQQEAQGITFQWTGTDGTHDTNLAEKATNPRHIIALLKEAFTNRNVPGNIYRGYDSEFQPQERVDYSISDLYTSGNKWGGWGIAKGTYTPNDEGLTMFLVELADNYNQEDAKNATVKTYAELVNYYSRFVKSVQLLTQSIRIEDGRKSSTAFSISGNLSRFFLIAKGKCSSAERMSTDAPFGDAFFFEEFSPVDNRGEGGDDCYARLVAGEAFPIIHDCPSVMARGHEFQMNKGTTDSYDVSNLLISIPDYRLVYHDNRKPNATSQKDYFNYNPRYQPSTILYTVALTAEAVSSGTEGKYTVNLQWQSALGAGAEADMPQIYKVYRVVNGSVSGEPIFTATDVTAWNEEVDQLQQGYHLTYLVTAQPVDLSLPQAQSNNARVTIPGLDPLERLVLILNGDAGSVFDPIALTNTYTNRIELRNGTGWSVQGKHIESGTTIEFYRIDSLGSELKHLADLKFTSIEPRKYDYQVVTDGSVSATGSFTSESDYGDIDFAGFSIVDQFVVSTAENAHPGLYKYQASFLPPANVIIAGAEGERIYSNQVDIQVYKTYATALNGFTQKQVDDDITRPETTLDNRVGVNMTLDNSSQVFNYALMSRKDGNWNDTGAHAQRQNSGNYMVHDGAGNSHEVAFDEGQAMMTQPIVEAAAQGQPGQYDYVPIISTFPTYGEYDHYNTYGADVKTCLVSAVDVQAQKPIASEDTFVDENDADKPLCCYYQTHLTITPSVPNNVVPQLVRVWKILPDGVAHEVQQRYMSRLDLTQRCWLYDQEYESGKGIVPIQDYALDEGFSGTIDLYDNFGGLNVTDCETQFTAEYIVRVYSKAIPTTVSSPRSNRAEETSDNWSVAEGRVQVKFGNGSVITSVNAVKNQAMVHRVDYYNLQGQRSNHPWSGINVVVTRNTDGSFTTSKIVLN